MDVTNVFMNLISELKVFAHLVRLSGALVCYVGYRMNKKDGNKVASLWALNSMSLFILWTVSDLVKEMNM